jgi:hypothetical protein
MDVRMQERSGVIGNRSIFEHDYKEALGYVQDPS